MFCISKFNLSNSNNESQEINRYIKHELNFQYPLMSEWAQSKILSIVAIKELISSYNNLTFELLLLFVRSDLLSHNEYLRGRTQRLVSRIMHKGVIEPLSSAITENINHKSAYVRRNTVVCLYNVFVNFGSDVIGDIDE